MCELLGMECNVPTDIVFSFSGLALRGGAKARRSGQAGQSAAAAAGLFDFARPWLAARGRGPLATKARAR